jgi:sphingomyelin phosphodiesterase acid-like 3
MTSKTASLIFFCGLLFICLMNPATAQKSVTDKNFLLIPDIHLNSATPHSMEINPSGPNDENDIDTDTFINLLNEIQLGIETGAIAKPEFIIYLGDLARHRRHGPEEVAADEKVVFEKLNTLSRHFTPAIPIFYTFGNHDSLQAVWGKFYYEDVPSEILPSPYEIAKNNGWLDGFLNTGVRCTANTNFTEPCIIHEDTKNGYYSAYLQNKLKLISLNTILFTPQRIGTNETDATNELNWLVAELENAAVNNESVLITTHVPFGNSLDDASAFWVAGDQENFLKILDRYKNIIIGIFAAHTHKEEAKIVNEELTKQNIAVLIYAAALSTSSGNAPSFKTIYFQNQENCFNPWLLTDYETFNFLETTFNFSTKPQPTINKLYRFSDYYCAAQTTSILGCATNITAKKMEHFYTAGNKNYEEKIKSPESIYVTIPQNSPTPTPKNNSSSHNLGIVAAIAGSVAAVGLGAELVNIDNTNHTN